MEELSENKQTIDVFHHGGGFHSYWASYGASTSQMKTRPS